MQHCALGPSQAPAWTPVNIAVSSSATARYSALSSVQVCAAASSEPGPGPALSSAECTSGAEAIHSGAVMSSPPSPRFAPHRGPRTPLPPATAAASPNRQSATHRDLLERPKLVLEMCHIRRLHRAAGAGITNHGSRIANRSKQSVRNACKIWLIRSRFNVIKKNYERRRPRPPARSPGTVGPAAPASGTSLQAP